VTKHDVVIIGGSLAGAACARQLARLGIDCIAFERDRFPRAKVCGGFISPGAVRCLEELGIVKSILASGAVIVRGARVRAGSVQVNIPFQRPGLGVSRAVLDGAVAAIPNIHQGCSVSKVLRKGTGFVVVGKHFEVECSVIVDAAGKLSRFTRRKTVAQFGIQYTEIGGIGDLLDFEFFEDGYGGSVAIEGGRSNHCFLIHKDGLDKYLGRRGCLVTGPIAYDKLPGDFIAIGDAAGMVDPFCGEGMRHALDGGMLAARLISAGLRRGAGYDQMRLEYETAWRRRWWRKRLLVSMLRRSLNHPRMFRTGLKLSPVSLLNRLWD
jgi:menaquinone-9 beta-reductase